MPNFVQANFLRANDNVINVSDINNYQIKVCQVIENRQNGRPKKANSALQFED